MAYSDLKGLLCCSLCLADFVDPVTLNCGHNFCRVCIKKALESQVTFHACPQCGQSQGKRPQLVSNTQLGNLAQHLRFTEASQKSSVVFCGSCTHSLVLAAKTCLLCGVPLCANHLRLHSKSIDHVLVDTNRFLLHHKCSKHNRALDRYCWNHKACVCEDCSVEFKHSGDQMLMIDHAFDLKKMRLRDTMKTLTTKHEQTLAGIRQLEKRKAELAWKMAHVNAMLNTGDAFAVLLETESDGFFFCDVQDEKRQKIKRTAIIMIIFILASAISVIIAAMYEKVPRS